MILVNSKIGNAKIIIRVYCSRASVNAVTVVLWTTNTRRRVTLYCRACFAAPFFNNANVPKYCGSTPPNNYCARWYFHVFRNNFCCLYWIRTHKWARQCWAHAQCLNVCGIKTKGNERRAPLVARFAFYTEQKTVNPITAVCSPFLFDANKSTRNI